MAKTVYNPGPTITGFKDAGGMVMIPNGASTLPDTVAVRAEIKLGVRGVCILADKAPEGESLKSVQARQKAAAEARFAKWDADQKIIAAGKHPDPPPDSAQLTAGFRRQAAVAEARQTAVSAQVAADEAARNAEVVEKAAAEAEGAETAPQR
jgi:hypothetical protein